MGKLLGRKLASEGGDPREVLGKAYPLAHPSKLAEREPYLSDRERTWSRQAIALFLRERRRFGYHPHKIATGHSWGWSSNEGYARFKYAAFYTEDSP